MSVSELIRWGALSAIVGGALWVLSDLWGLLLIGLGDERPFSEEATTASFAATTGLSLLGAVLILFGLVGFNLRQVEAAGILGKLGSDRFPRDGAGYRHQLGHLFRGPFRSA